MDGNLQTLQHLLRNLNNFSRLRKNALVESTRLRYNISGRHLHAHVRAAVVRALEAMVRQQSIEHGAERAKRWQAIVQRCDLNDELHATVAADLGLAHAQFYVERKAAQESLTAIVMQELGAPETMPAAPSLAEMRIEFAINERERGHIGESVRLLEDVIASGPDKTERVAAITELSEAYWSLGARAKFPYWVAQARALCYGEPNPNVGLEIEMQRIEALAACAEGAVDRCIEALERVRERFSHANAPSDRRAHALALRTLLDLAGLHLESGNAAGAESYLSQAERLFEQAGTSRPEIRNTYLHWRARLASFCGEPRQAVRMLSDSLSIALDNGLIASTMLASYGLGCTFLQVRRRMRAREHAQNAVHLSELLTNAPEHVYTSLLLADVERVSGHSEQAVARAQKAYEQFDKADPRGWSSALTVVLALDGAGRSFEALQLLDSVSVEFRQKSMLRYMGKSERIRAGVYSNLSRGKEARIAIDNALQILERCGSLDELGQAYELSAQLTRNRTHTKRSREIRAQLTID